MKLSKLKNKKKYKILTVFFTVSLIFFNPILIKADHNIKNYDLQETSDTFAGISKPDWYKKPNSYQELVGWYKKLEENFPRYLEVFKANELYNTGKVDGGYDLYYVRLTNETSGFHKPEVLFLGSPHGDETVGTIGLYWFTNWMLRKAYTDEICSEYSKDWLRWLLDNREIYIVVSQNPSGFDRVRRHDINGWDLNREADFNGPGTPTGGIWGSVNGKTLRAFVDNHVIRVGCDFHGGARMILYPWSSTHPEVKAESTISEKLYTHVPPDFYFFDVSANRLGDFMGDYGGALDEDSIGTIPDTVGYEAPGSIASWAYGADIKENPEEDNYVNDETFGNYPGAGILWFSPEMSKVKNPKEQRFGNETIDRFGAEVRRFVLHQTDLAQPYVRWMNRVPENNTVVYKNESITFQWQVNGSLVVDETSLQWRHTGEDVNESKCSSTGNLVRHKNYYEGGTGWDKASDGQTKGVTYKKELFFNKSGDYTIFAKAKVDQKYKNTVDFYDGVNSYLRIVKERTNPTYSEYINGTDGDEYVNGSLWWRSPVRNIKVIDKTLPKVEIVKPTNGFYFNNKKIGNISIFPNITLAVGTINLSIKAVSNQQIIQNVSFFINGEKAFVDDKSPYSFKWNQEAFGLNNVKIVAYCHLGKKVQQEIKIWKFF